MKEKRKKILILTASPLRDSLVDEMLSEHLTKMGNEVFVKPCLREGRDAILELKPDVAVVPPIRNPYSRDMAVQIKKWGMGVVTRHTEPSCDWQDWKGMDIRQRSEILGSFPYQADLEIVWSEDEAQILNRRNTPMRAVSAGSFSADEYLNKKFRKRFGNRDKFNKKYGFKKTRTILIASPWGFADSAPDLNIDDIPEARRETECLQRHLIMITQLYKALPDCNILVTLHPGVVVEPYKKSLEMQGIKLDTESTSMELLCNSDILIHAGSTMAMGAHFLDKPAFQFGDVNLKTSDSWWSKSGRLMSELSPNYIDIAELIKAVSAAKIKTTLKTNINPESLKKLEQGRYGIMDGKAAQRAAKLINKIGGEFKYCWPESSFDYSRGRYARSPEQVIQYANCGICKHPFAVVKQDWLNKVCSDFGSQPLKIDDKYTHCPWCGTRFFINEFSDNPGETNQPKIAT